MTKVDIQYCRTKFFKHTNKIKQDTLLSHCIAVKIPKQSRKRKPDTEKRRQVAANYKLRTENSIKDVCQKLFIQAYSVSQKRVQTVIKQLMKGDGIFENRGGDSRSKTFLPKKLKVRKFISELKGTESHYGRAKSRRIYLSSEMNISILHKLYNDSVAGEYKVNYKYFSRIFNKEFNIGFGRPATDVCSFCVRHQRLISLEKIPVEKQKLLTNLRVHKLRSKQFHTFLGESPDHTVSVCFDLQQVQVLPRVPIGEAFYAQQLSFYAFCITDISTRNPIFYTWLENQAARGCIEIGSALLDFLRRFDIPPNVSHLRLFCDGCSGQNKNNHIVHMLMVWLQNEAPQTLESLTILFPVRGHSYMPADRVFGRVEKRIRAKNVIKSPNEYYDLYSSIGTVRKLGSDWKLYNIKETVSSMNKLQGIFEAKRIILKRSENRCLVKVENFYRNDDPARVFSSLLKKGKSLRNVKFSEVPLIHEVKPKKLKSLEKLLIQLASENWREDPELQWLSPIIPVNLTRGMSDADVEDQHEDHDTQYVCDCLDDDGGIKV